MKTLGQKVAVLLKKNPKVAAQDELFKLRLGGIIDPCHELVKLAGLIDWDGLESDLSGFYCTDNGRPGGSIRLMSGLCFLKDIKGLSDEELCAVWCENPYFQHFYGKTFFQHCSPVEPPSLSIFRNRIGKAGMERMLEEIIKTGLQTGTIPKRDLGQVTVDTTVQKKAVHFPTDVRLCHKARDELGALAREENVALRQSYVHKSKNAVFMRCSAGSRSGPREANRYMVARQMKCAQKKIKEVRNYLGRVVRNIETAITQVQVVSPALERPLARRKLF